MRKPDVYLREYCQRLSDDNLKFLHSRLDARLGGDLPEALDFLGGVKELDKWLASADTCYEIYDMLDLVGESVARECSRRYD